MRIRLLRAAGIDVFLHWTFLFAPLYLVFDLWYLQGLEWPVVGLFLLLLLAVFVCVLFHEYGHALVAKWFGIQTRDIIMTPLGGIARLERMPRKPFQELMITIAGPLVNLGLAIAIFAFLVATERPFVPQPGIEGVSEFPAVLMWMNMFLFLFNLIPAFPMDGGRILRSSLAFVVGHEKATFAAGVLGQVMALVFCVVALTLGPFSLLLIGVFVFFAARIEMAASKRAAQVSQPQIVVESTESTG